MGGVNRCDPRLIVFSRSSEGRILATESSSSFENEPCVATMRPVCPDKIQRSAPDVCRAPYSCRAAGTELAGKSMCSPKDPNYTAAGCCLE